MYAKVRKIFCFYNIKRINWLIIFYLTLNFISQPGMMQTAGLN